MEYLLFTLIITVTAVIIIVAFTKICKIFFNIKALQQKPDSTNQKNGIVYNETTKQLEADQALITPF